MKTACRVGLHVDAAKTEVLSVPGPHVDIFLENYYSLPSCRQFVYLAGQIANCSDDLLRRQRLAWSAFGRLRTVLASAALSDDLRPRLFSATVDTVLLYNAVTWTMTHKLELQLDAAHSHLLRAAFNAHCPEEGAQP